MIQDPQGVHTGQLTGQLEDISTVWYYGKLDLEDYEDYYSHLYHAIHAILLNESDVYRANFGTILW
jgi:N-formylglutamate amidohydrolase